MKTLIVGLVLVTAAFGQNRLYIEHNEHNLLGLPGIFMSQTTCPLKVSVRERANYILVEEGHWDFTLYHEGDAIAFFNLMDEFGGTPAIAALPANQKTPWWVAPLVKRVCGLIAPQIK